MGVRQKLPKVVKAWRAAGKFVAVAVVTAFLLMVLDNEPPYDITGMSIERAVVAAAAAINITYIIKRNRPTNCGPATVTREFKEPISGRLYLIDPVVVKSVNIADGKFTVTVPLPPDAADIPLLYRSTACYFCNPLKSTFNWRTCIVSPQELF